VASQRRELDDDLRRLAMREHERGADFGTILAGRSSGKHACQPSGGPTPKVRLERARWAPLTAEIFEVSARPGGESIDAL
jgi:hypothetical protein